MQPKLLFQACVLLVQEFLGDFDGYPAINTCLAGSKAFRTIFNGDNDGAEPATGTPLPCTLCCTSGSTQHLSLHTTGPYMLRSHPTHRMHAGKQKYFLRKRGLILDDSTLTKDAAFVLASTAYSNGIRVITLDKLHFNYGIALESIWVLPPNRPALLPRASCTP